MTKAAGHSRTERGNARSFLSRTLIGQLTRGTCQRICYRKVIINDRAAYRRSTNRINLGCGAQQPILRELAGEKTIGEIASINSVSGSGGRGMSTYGGGAISTTTPRFLVNQ